MVAIYFRLLVCFFLIFMVVAFGVLGRESDLEGNSVTVRERSGRISKNK